MASRVVLDAGGAAPVLPLAVEAWSAAVADGWADPRRLHAEGRRARLVLDTARERVAETLGVRPDEVLFPPHHAAAARAAVLGLAAARPDAPVVLTSAVEHSAVLHAAGWHAGRGGRHELLGVDRLGRVDPGEVAGRLGGGARRDVCVLAVQQANGEIGTVQPLDGPGGIGEAAAAAGVPLVVDAGASLGFAPPPAAADVLVANPRTWGSVPGAGLLVLRSHVRWRPHEPGEAEGAHVRPGEAPGEVDVPAAVAAAVTLAAVEQERALTADRLDGLVRRIRATAAGIADVEVAGDPVARLPHVVTFSALFLPGELLVSALDRAGFAVASGSACTADTLEPSHVLAATGGLTHGNVRVVLPAGVAAADVERFCHVLPGTVAALRDELGVTGL